MTIAEQFVEAFKDVAKGKILTNAEIKEIVLQKHNVTDGSILPTAYCYNRWSVGVPVKDRLCLFEYVEKDKFRYLGEGYNYTGKVYREVKKTGELIVVGEWNNGMETMYANSKWEPSIEEYNPDITVERWRKFWNDKEIFTEALRTFFERLMLMGGTATYSQIAVKFCGDAKEHKHFPDISSLGKRLSKRGECKLYNDDSGNGWAVPCFGRRVKKSIDGDVAGFFLFKLRDELVEALQQEGLQFGGVNVDIPVSGGSVMLKHLKNLILYGPPGTGKTYNTVNYAVAIIEGKTVEEIAKADRKEIVKKYNDYKAKGLIEFCTFHQSFGYEEFIEGIKPDVKNENVVYKKQDGIFKAFCNSAKENPEQNYIFIIDEINRGNISKIFGELITLIEDSKRIGADEEMRARLPYSGEEFGVPNNVYLLGTMNTADRSIALIDTALRRRFKFVEMQPDVELLNGIEVEGVKIKELLDMINKRIEVLYDREHTIGHSFFMGLNNASTIADLAEVFECNVIPLLKEYFYNDFGRIAAVLGDNGKSPFNFFDEQDNVAACLKNSNIEVAVPTSYKFQKDALTKPEAYKKIYE